MEIRLTRHAPTSLVAVSLARDPDGLPDAVRLVDESVADAVELLVERGIDGGAVANLDALIREATTRTPS